MPPVKDPTTGKFVKAADADQQQQQKAEAEIPKENLANVLAFSKAYLANDKPADKKAGEDEADPKGADKHKSDEDKKREQADALKSKTDGAKRQTKPVSATDKLLARTTDVLEKVTEKLSEKSNPEKPKGTEAAKDEDPDAGLPSENKRKLTVLRQMEKDFPDKYKGISDRYKQGITNLKDYISKWQKDHPGEAFDETSEEHEEFYKNNDVNWDDDDYVETLAAIKSQATNKSQSEIEAQLRKTNEELSELKRKEALRESASAIAKEQIKAARSTWDIFGKDYTDLVKPDGSVDKAKLDELSKADPIGIGIRIQAAERVEAFTAETYKLLNGLQPYNKENKLHVYLADFALSKEKELLSKPVEDRLDAAGREFKPRSEFAKLPEDKRKDYWTFSSSDLGALIADAEATAAEKMIKIEEEKFQRFAAARGIDLKQNGGTARKPAVENLLGRGNREEEGGENDDYNPNEKPRSPSSVSQPKLAATSQSDGDKSTTGVNAFIKKAIGKL